MRFLGIMVAALVVDAIFAVYSSIVLFACYYLARRFAPDLNLPALHYLFFFALALVYHHLQPKPLLGKKSE